MKVKCRVPVFPARTPCEDTDLEKLWDVASDGVAPDDAKQVNRKDYSDILQLLDPFTPSPPGHVRLRPRPSTTVISIVIKAVVFGGNLPQMKC